MNLNSNIDELLNGFIDDELSPRQLTEVQRLIANDDKVRAKLEELRKIKAMVGSLPCEEVPEELFEDIKASLERTFLLGHEKQALDTRQGVMHLFFRKVLTAAAMIVLVGVLGYVVYMILDVDTNPSKTFVIEDKFENEAAPSNQVIQTEIEEARTARNVDDYIAVFGEFNAVLELGAKNLIAAEAFIKRTLRDSDLVQAATFSQAGDKAIININSSAAKITGFVEQLRVLWPQLDSAVLIVCENDTDRIKVNKINNAQLVQIFNQQRAADSVQKARNFAFLNNSTLLSADENMLAADDEKDNQISPIRQPIPKPVLTSGQKDDNQKVPAVENSRKVSLKIVLTGFSDHD